MKREGSDQLNSQFRHLRLVALDMDGVAMTDTFSPVIYRLVQSWGGVYDADVERHVFSRPRIDAARYLKKRFHSPLSEEAIIESYFRMRDEFLVDHYYGPVQDLEKFLSFIKSLGLQMVCYGGLPPEFFYKHLSDYLDYFDGEKYICTNDFRPGIKEIVTDYSGYDFDNVLFIDDVNTVAEEARKRGTPFIGVPSDFSFGFQKEDMLKGRVKYIVSSVHEIRLSLLKEIDTDLDRGELWM